MFPLEGPEAVALLARQRDPEILQLARNHVSLDIFGTLIELGGQDAFERVRGSMLAYHAALKQESGDVAVMLLVTAIEALLAPRQFWGKEKVTSRFVQGLIDLCPEVVEETVRHGNVEQAFEVQLRGSPTKRRKQLLSRVYDSRSLPTHTGLAPSAMPFGGVDSSGMRVALLDDLARGALLAYLESPRSSTVGHPMYRTE